MLSAKQSIQITDNISIHSISGEEAKKLAEIIRKKNVFARHSWERHFYVERALELAGRTVVEVFAPGEPKDIADSAEVEATFVEHLVILASTFLLDRRGLQKKLAVSIKPRDEIDFIIGPKFHFLRSRKRGASRAKPGLIVDGKIGKAFKKVGFQRMLNMQRHAEIESRIIAALEWLFQSRTEPDLPAAIVKTAIACETLLIFSESESLSQTLSERMAFILGRTAAERELFSRTMKRFYEVRSGIVHGSKRKRKYLSHEILETADRLVLATALTMYANPELWNTAENMRLWCEGQRWGKNIADRKLPIAHRWLDKLGDATIKACQQ